MRWVAATLVGAAMLLSTSLFSATRASAQPTPQDGDAEAPREKGDADDARIEAAKKRFFDGLVLLKQEKWGAALAELQESRRLHPTRAATRNAAICLRQLGRYDEALGLYELLPTFADPSGDDRLLREREAQELQGLVGLVRVRDAADGAVVVIDGVEKGPASADRPIRVSAGTHNVQVHKDGYVTFRQQVEVAGKTEVEVRAPLRPLSASGRLHVAEKDARKATVLVDDVRVGDAPWEGAVTPGAHYVTLSSDGELGSQPVEAPVREGELTRLTIALEELGGELDVHPEPASATVALDGVSLGRGPWHGRVRVGKHRVELASEGYIPLEMSITASPREPVSLQLQLERDRTSTLWAKHAQPRVVLDLGLGPLIGPSMMSSATARGCDDACALSPSYGAIATLHGGYRFGIGLTLGLEAGWAFLGQRVDDRADVLKEIPDALRIDAGRVDDTLSMNGFLVAGSVGYATDSRVVFGARLGAGAYIAAITDRRSGTFAPQGSSDAYDIAPVAETHGAQFFALLPALHVGYRATPLFEVGASVRALVLVAASTPAWSNESDIHGPGFLGYYGGGALTKSGFALVSPTLDLGLSF